MQRTKSYTLDELGSLKPEHSVGLAALASSHSPPSATTSPPGSMPASPIFLPTVAEPGPGGVFSCPHALAASASAAGPMQRRRRPGAPRAGPGQHADEDDDGGSSTSSSSSLPRLSRLSVGVGPVNANIAKIRKHLGTLRRRYISIWQLVLLAGLMQVLQPDVVEAVTVCNGGRSHLR